MKENEVKQKIAEINEKMDVLRAEKRQYQDILDNDKKNKEREHCERAVGKYFKTKGLNENKKSYVFAFKVLELEKDHNFRYARCLAIIKGYRSTCWDEYGVSILTLPLYYDNELRMLSKPNDLKMIDFYQEISMAEFNDLLQESITEIERA